MAFLCVYNQQHARTSGKRQGQMKELEYLEIIAA
jgi:hypothetical protein